MQKIQIVEPCHENWNTMTTNEQGRHCQKCVKTVYDVCNTSDEEIWNKYEENNGSMCIRIQTDRVDSPAPTKPWYIRMRYAAAAAILTLMLSVQEKLAIAQTETTDNTVDENVRTIENMKITGVVLDSLSDENKVAFATVILFKNNRKIGGAFTNVEGRFELTATEEVKESDSISIEISQIGFTTFTKDIATLKDSIDCEIYCKEEHVCLKEVVIAIDRAKRERVDIILGAMPGGTGRMTGVMRSNGRRKILDDYDTKTFYSDEIERFNLGR